MPNEAEKSICFIIPKYVTFSTGGAEIQVFYLISEFLRRNWRVELICGGKGFEEQIKQSTYHDSRIIYRYYKFHKIRSLEFFDVFRLLLKTKSKHYYQRTDFALTGATALYCRLFNKMMIYAFAQDKDANRNKYLSEFKSFSYRSVFKRLIRMIDFMLIDKMVEYGKLKSDFIVCQNKYQRELFKYGFGKKAVVIPSSYPKKEIISAQKENIVLWVGNMSIIKHPEIFIELVSQLNVLNNWRFVMIGSVSPEIKALKQLPDNLELLGELSFVETENWFNRSKVLVNTSESEGMPNTFIQSWVYKVLVLSLKVDPDKLLEKEECGLNCNGDVELLKNSLQALMNEELEYNEYLEKGSRLIEQQFSLEKNVDALINLYQA